MKFIYKLVNKTALYLAVEKEDVEIVQLLINVDDIDANIICEKKYGRDYDQKIWSYERTALYSAIEKGNIKIIQLLMTINKLNVNVLCKTNIGVDKKTALYLAVEKENVEIIHLLLNNDQLDFNVICNKNTKESEVDEGKAGEKNRARVTWKKYHVKNEQVNEKAAFYLAVEKENIGIISQLAHVKDKIDINIRYKSSTKQIGKEMEICEKTPLFSAVEKNNIEVVNFILQIPSIDVNEKSFYRLGSNQAQERSPLHLAVEKGYVDIIKLLLNDHNIDININDENKKKPIDYTVNDEIKQLLNN